MSDFVHLLVSLIGARTPVVRLGIRTWPPGMAGAAARGATARPGGLKPCIGLPRRAMTYLRIGKRLVRDDLISFMQISGLCVWSERPSTGRADLESRYQNPFRSP
jgi:hypothetical protein